MTTLLSLPREIRDDILRFALPDDRPAPESPAASLDRVELSHADVGGMELYEDQTSVFVERERPTGFPSLLLVNKQIHAEVLPLLQQHDANLVLDIMYVKECGWWPTWLSSTCLRRARFSTLYVQIRIFDPPEGVPFSWSRDNIFYRGDIYQSTRNISPACVTTAFHQIILAFLRHGPRYGPKVVEDVEGWPPASPCSAQNLVIDVLLPENAEDHLVLGSMHGVINDRSMWDFFLQHRFLSLETWPDQWPKPEVINPEYLPAEKLACFVWTWLRMVLSFEDPFEESENFFGGFGVLEIRVNGEQRKTADLSLWLERLHREQEILSSWSIAEKTKLTDELHELRKARLISGGNVTHSCGNDGDDSFANVQSAYADYHRWSCSRHLDSWSCDSWGDWDLDYYSNLPYLH